MTTVLVTGATGFVGSAVLPLLRARGMRILAAPGHSGPRDEPGVSWGPAGDLAETAEAVVTWAAAQGPPDLVLHLAGFAAVGRAFRDPARAMRANVVTTQALLDALLAKNLRPRFLLASSSAVYGRVDEAKQPIREETPVAPVSPYGLTKAMAETSARYAERLGMPVLIARFFNLVGPGQGEGYVLSDFARAFRARVPVMKIGRLEAKRDFLDVRDGAEAILAVAERAEAGSITNIGSGQAVSLEWAIDRLIEKTGHRPILEYDPARSRPVDVPTVVADITRLRALGFTPRRRIEDTLAEMAA